MLQSIGSYGSNTLHKFESGANIRGEARGLGAIIGNNLMDSVLNSNRDSKRASQAELANKNAATSSNTNTTSANTDANTGISNEYSFAYPPLNFAQKRDGGFLQFERDISDYFYKLHNGSAKFNPDDLKEYFARGFEIYKKSAIDAGLTDGNSEEYDSYITDRIFNTMRAANFGTVTETAAELDLGYIAKAIMRILEINNNLMASEQIRVISISSGFRGGDKGEEEITEAIEAAKRAGVFVITSTPNTDYNFYMTGIGRDLYADPDDVNSYSPGLLWTNSIDMYRDIYRENNLLLVPMDSRTHASFTGNSNYAYNRESGNSLTNPWLAGLYALCIQVKPEITSEEFIETALETGNTMIYQHDGENDELGIIVNPAKMIERLSER